jgi:hypothetical protein
MASDLDQAYVINGDDLRRALAKNNWTTFSSGKLQFPEDAASWLLREIAKPYEPKLIPVGHLADTPCTCGDRGSLTGIEDRELDAMQAILDALDGLTPATRRRIAIWLDNRTTEEPPF